MDLKLKYILPLSVSFVKISEGQEASETGK